MAARGAPRAFRLRPIARATRGPEPPSAEACVPTQAAALAGLRYVAPGTNGLRRVRSGRGFRVLDGRGRPVREAARLRRIRALAIPPAWRDVWICASSRGHVQATGRDARGRKQYRYHARWRAVRDGAKYGHVVDFARRLPALRARTARDLREPGLSRRKVVAAVVRLLEATLIRVGNEEYARQNRSFGLTTLRARHASVAGSRLEFRFRGKSARNHLVRICDRRLGRIVKRCQELPGQALFQYLDELGRRRTVGSSDVNAYLREATRSDFTAKDFRTWAGTVLAACALAELPPAHSRRQGARSVARAIQSVSTRLGNTPAICRRCYVHPAVIEAYLDGSLREGLHAAGAPQRPRGLPLLEARVLALVASRLPADAATPAELGTSRTTSRGSLSSRSPRKDG
jgi:DNA topoisomerase-1